MRGDPHPKPSPRSGARAERNLTRRDLSTHSSRLPIVRDWPLVAAIALVGVLYWPTLIELARYWSHDENYSHGFLVPVVSVIFAAVAARRAGRFVRPEVPRRSVQVDLLSLAFGLIVHLVSAFTNFLLLDVGGLVLTLRGAVFVLGGRRTWRGVPVLIEGSLLHVPGYTLEVGEACSGMRQVMAFLALSVVVAKLYRGRDWSRWVLILLAVPIAVAANCLRIGLTGVLIRIGGAGWVTGSWHTLEGLITMLLGLALFAASAQMLRGRSSIN